LGVLHPSGKRKRLREKTEGKRRVLGAGGVEVKATTLRQHLLRSSEEENE
jgi:hypothetical protein